MTLLLLIALPLVMSSASSGHSIISTVVAIVEAESFTLPPGAGVVSDSSASGGRAIRLNSNGTATIQGPLNSASDRIVVRARGVLCNGAPRMVITMDGVQILNASVSSTSWTDYPITTNTTAANHTMTISFTNDYSTRRCSRDLLVDKATFFGGTVTPTPSPTITPTPSPTPTPTITPTPSPTPIFDPTAQLFNGDYETGDLSQWDVCQSIAHNNPCSTMPAHYSISAVSDVKRQGNYAARFELRDGDCPPEICQFGERTEVQETGVTSGGQEGDERWYQWSTQFSAQFPSNHASQGWGLVNQWHANAAGSPPVGMYVDVADGQWGLRIHQQSSPGVFINNYVPWKTPLSNGAWQDIKLFIKWSTNDAVGFIELWHNGVQQTFTAAPCAGQTRCSIRTLVPGGNGVYYKQGYYRNFNVSGTGVVYHDGFTAARTEAGLGSL